MTALPAVTNQMPPLPQTSSFFEAQAKPKRNVRRAFVAHQLCLQFENCAKSNAHTQHTTHTHTQLSPPLHTHNTHPNIYALTNVEIMQVNRLIGSSNGYTLRPEEKEEQKEELLPRKYTLNMCVCVCSK